MTQTALPLFGPPVAQSRKRDTRTAKTAAAMDREGRDRQWKQILVRLLEGSCSADTAAAIIGKHRSVASTRFGVLANRGLVEKAGEWDEPDADGHVRKVLRYRLTAAGEIEARRIEAQS